MTNTLPQSSWDDAYSQYQYRDAADDDALVQWIRRWIPPRTGTCLEFGCFPGRYLTVFGKLGYELHGVDLTPRVEQDFAPWLSAQGYRVGQIARDDALLWEPNRRYDVVCSFGFIEHFDDWRAVLRRQARLVDRDGWLMITAPNFRGALQWLLHRALDARNLKRHRMGSMDVRAWAEEAEKLGFAVAEAAYIGRFEFWHADEERNGFQRLGLKLARRAERWLRRLPAGHRLYSPYCGLVARRTNEVNE